MRRTILIGLTALWTTTFGQDTVRYLEGNNVSATIANTGIFFRGADVDNPGYEFPKDENNFLIYSNTFWFGAKDELGNLKIAAELSGGTTEEGVPKHDLFPGAIAEGTAEAPAEPYAADVYVVSKEEILYHAANYAVWDYVAPEAITNWPAHGNVALGLDYQLAPFADLNGNEIYEPELGEYPEIRGDHAAYVILNDTKGMHTASGGEQLGIEVHFMFYQFESDDYLDNTTFVNVRVINRGSVYYPEFIVGNFLDGDIGHYEDDLAACDFDKNMMYFYNGDGNDEPSGGHPGYGDEPPALGVVALNHEMEVGLAAPTSSPFWEGAPSNYWNILSGYYTYSDPELVTDYRTVMASGSSAFAPGEVKCFDYAILASAGGSAIENRDNLPGMADNVKAFYENSPNIYCDFTLGLGDEQIKSPEVSIYPNPSTGTFVISTVANYNLSIYSLDARLVYSSTETAGNTQVKLDLTPGTYMLILDSNEGRFTKKLVIK